MDNFIPLDESLTKGGTERFDTEIWNLVGNYSLVETLRQTYEASKCQGIIAYELSDKVKECAVLLETECYDLLAAKHKKPSEEYIPAYVEAYVWEFFAYAHIADTTEGLVPL